RYPEAEKLLLQVVAIEPRREGAAAYLLQDLYSQVGDKEKSKNWMSKIPLTPERADAQARFNEDLVSDGRKAVYEKRAQIEREKQQLPLPKTSDERTLQS